MGTVIVTDESGAEHAVEVRGDSVIVNGASVQARQDGDGRVRLRGKLDAAVGWVAASGDTRWTFIDGDVFTFTTGRPRRRQHRGSGVHGSLTAPMPATVVKVHVAPGDAVRAGEVVILLEAMKMELPVRSPADGRVVAVNCREGELVQPGVSLVEMAD
jgi:3-methylcrotonyl-CoA carboxylase alpha subunit